MFEDFESVREKSDIQEYNLLQRSLRRKLNDVSTVLGGADKTSDFK